MTALGAIIALLPLAIGIGTGSELHQPLAIAVIGVLIAMPLLLIVLPSLYYFNIEQKKAKLSNRRFHLFIVFEMEK
jgi:Cu/Ag efflux pump CusA